MAYPGARAHYRQPFDPERAFVVAKPLKINGRDLLAGRRFPKRDVQPRLLRRLFETRHIGYAEEDGRDRSKPPTPEAHIRRLGGTLEQNLRPKPPAPPEEEILLKPGEIPDDWRDLSAKELRNLLKSVFPGMTFINRLEMTDAVEAELARRQKAAQDGPA